MTRIAIVGAGSIGVAWAIVFARAGHSVVMHDVSSDRLSDAVAEVEQRAAMLRSFGLLEGSLSVSVADSLAEAVVDADHVQECVVEDLAVKRSLFASLDGLVGGSCVLASSTSMIPASQFAAALSGRSRCLVVHPGNPPYLLPVAELVPAPFTDQLVVERTRSLLSSAGMTPVLVRKEIEGFVFNRLQGALLREAYALVRDGVASPDDIDVVVSHGLGPRWSILGPFATAELNTRGGIQRHAQVMGPAYARMGAERGDHGQWTAELVEEVAAALAERLPRDQWAEHVEARDLALMKLTQAFA